MKSNTQFVSLNDWIESFSKTMALELIKLIDAQSVNRGAEVAKMVSMQFLAAFTSVTVIRALGSERAEGIASQDQYDKVSADFLAHKVAVQDAVAAAFSGAMSEFTKKNINYYCQIKVVPEVNNKFIN